MKAYLVLYEVKNFVFYDYFCPKILESCCDVNCRNLVYTAYAQKFRAPHEIAVGKIRI